MCITGEMASDSLLVIGRRSPRGAGVTNSSSLFTPRFSSGLQDLHFFSIDRANSSHMLPDSSSHFLSLFSIHFHIPRTHIADYSCTHPQPSIHKSTKVHISLFGCTLPSQSGWILLTQTAASYQHFGLVYTPDSHHVKPLCCLSWRGMRRLRHFMPYSNNAYAVTAFSVLFYVGRQGGLVVRDIVPKRRSGRFDSQCLVLSTPQVAPLPAHSL